MPIVPNNNRIVRRIPHSNDSRLSLALILYPFTPFRIRIIRDSSPEVGLLVIIQEDERQVPIEFRVCVDGLFFFRYKLRDNGVSYDDEISQEREEAITMEEGSIVEFSVDPVTRRVSVAVGASSFTFETLFPEGAWTIYPVYGFVKGWSDSAEYELLPPG